MLEERYPYNKLKIDICIELIQYLFLAVALTDCRLTDRKYNRDRETAVDRHPYCLPILYATK